MKQFQQPTPSIRAPARRSGAVMVVAIICLIVATALLAASLKMAVTGRKQVRQEQLRMQAVWLAEAGLERAAAQFGVDAEYDGETWKLAGKELDGIHAGRVVISIKQVADDVGRKVVTATATYPEGAALSAQVTRTATVSLGENL